MSIIGLPPKYFVDPAGNYLGSFSGYEKTDDATGEVIESFQPLPDDPAAIEVPTGPEHGSQKWLGAAWSPAPPPPSDADHAEIAIRDNKALLALGRIMTGDDALTEDALVTLVRAKLP